MCDSTVGVLSMISIYKVVKEDFTTMFAIDFSDEDATFFFFVDGEWEEDSDKADIKSMEFIYGESVEVNSLKNLDLGESVELSEGGSITCLVNFDNNDGNVLEFLDSYAKMMEMV